MFTFIRSLLYIIQVISMIILGTSLDDIHSSSNMFDILPFPLVAMYMRETMKLKKDYNLTFGIDFLEQNELNVML